MYDSATTGDEGSQRGQAGVLGFALLVGVVAIGVTTVLLVGGAGLTDTQERLDVERATQTLTLVDSQASTVALGDNPVQSVSVDALQRSGTLRAEATGRLVVETADGTTYVDQELGTLLYRSDGGEVVAYQGGGVWRGTGTESRMVSPPEFHYRDGTLTLPIVVVNPDTSGASSDGRVTFTPNGSSRSLAPGVIENEILTVTITSDYYVAWGDYFERRVDGVTVEYDHAADTVEITLAELDIDGDYTTGVVAAGDVTADNGNPNIESEVLTSGTVTGDVSCDAGTGDDCITEGASIDETPLDMAIERLMVDSEANDPEVSLGDGGTLDDDGTGGDVSYYAEGFVTSDTVTFDLTDGNVTLFVDGNVGLDGGSIRVENGEDTNHYAKVFTNGDFAMRGGTASVTVESDNATRFQMFGTSEMQFNLGQSNNPGYVGTVYAPRNEPAEGQNEVVADEGGAFNSAKCKTDADFCMGQGSGTFRGAVNAGPFSVHQSTDFVYADELEGFRPSLPTGAVLPPPITFLHVSANRVDVTGVRGSGDVSLQTTTVTPDPDGSDSDGDSDADDGDSDDDSDSDSGDSDSDSGAAPSASITETQPNGNKKYDVTYDVSDPDGDLDSVTVTVTYDAQNGPNTDIQSEDKTVTIPEASGSDASATVTVDLGENYDEVTRVDLTVTDDDNNTGTDTETNPSN